MRIPSPNFIRKTSDSICSGLDRFLNAMQAEQEVNKDLEAQYKKAYKAERLGDLTERTMDALESLQEARTSNKALYDATMKWLDLEDPLVNVVEETKK